MVQSKSVQLSNKRITNISRMKIEQYIQNLKDLTSQFEQMTDADYIEFMRERFEVYEHTKDENINITLKRLQSHYKQGFFNRPIEDSPILLTKDGE